MPVTAMIRAAAFSMMALAGIAVPDRSAIAATEKQFQVTFDPSCAGLECTGNLAAAGVSKKHRQHITRVSCLIISAAESVVGVSRLILHDTGTNVLEQYLPFDPKARTAHTINQAVDMLVVGQQNARITLRLVDPAVAGAARCTVIGTSIQLD